MAKDGVKQSPSFQSYTTLGLAFSQAGQHREALAAFEQSLAISPEAPLAYNNLCAEHNALGEWGLALPLCQKALALQPGFQIAENNLRVSETARSASDKRITELKKNIEKKKDVDAARVNLGLEYFKRGENEAAISNWLLIPKGSPQFAVAQNDLASAYILLRQYDKARAALDKALKLDPNNPLFKNNERWLNASMSTHK